MSSAEGSGNADPFDPSAWKIISVVVAGSFLSLLNATIINVSVASLAVELHSRLEVIQWVISGYLLTLSIALPLSGWLIDRMGGRAVYLWSFAAFTLSSVLCGLAWSVGSLIGFRLLQGLSGGLLAPMAQMILARVAGKHMARVVGYAALPVILGPLLGPIIAGAILKYASWRWLFLVNLPIGALVLVLAAMLLPEDRHHIRQRGLDWVGLALLSPGLALFLYGTDRLAGHHEFSALTASACLLAGFLWVARRKGDAALIELRLFKGKTFSASAITQFLSNGLMYAGQMLIPIYLVHACGRSPTQMGWLMAPLGFGMMCTYPAMGTLTRRFGVRAVSVAGASMAALGTIPLIYLAIHGLDQVMLAAALLVRGAGQSAIGVPSISAAYASTAPRDLPMATTSLNIVQRLGGPTMTTACATFLGWRLKLPPLHQALLNPYASVFLLLAALHILVLAAALALPGRLSHTMASALV